MKRLGLLLTIATVPFTAFSQTSTPRAEPELIRVVQRTGTFVGPLVSRDEESVTVHDIKTDKVVAIRSEDIILERRLNGDQEIVAFAGLSSVMAWRVRLLIGPTEVGRVAEVSSSQIYTTLGSKAGLEKGHRLTVFRDEGDVRDPTTGEVLDRRRNRIATLEVFEVRDRLSVAKFVDPPPILPKVGDEVEFDRTPIFVAILPFVDDVGRVVKSGQRLSEELVTGMVRRGTRVVERSQLNRVLDELSLQQTNFFDPAVAQRIGKQLGASLMVTGSILSKGRASDAHLRVIRVETGEILYAVAGKIELADASAVEPPTVPAGRPKVAVPPPLVASGLVSYYSCDDIVDNVLPDQMRRYDGRLENVVTTTGVRGGKGIYFDGRSFVSFDTHDFGSNFSIAMWIRPTQRSDGNSLCLISNDDSGVHRGWGWQISHPNSIDRRLGFFTGAKGKREMLRSPPDTVIMDRWSHVALTVNLEAQRFQIYRDGISLKLEGGVVPGFRTSGKWRIGTFQYPRIDHPYKGVMDEIRIYAKELAPSEVSLLAKGS